MTPTLIISLDFELFWGLQQEMPLSAYEANVLGGRAAIPKLLELFKKYGIHATWDTVGFQMAENYEELQRFFPPEHLRPSYEKKEMSTYRMFEQIGTDEESAPCFYCPSLVELVRSYPHQEIGCHTFSHYYCREPGQTTEQFEADLLAAKAIAKSKGIELTSLVFPKNETTPEHIAAARKLGFTAFRDEEHDWIHRIKNFQVLRFFRLWDAYFNVGGYETYIPQNEGGLVNLIGSRAFRAFFEPLAFLEKQKVRRIKAQMRHAAKRGETYHLWWHPHNIGLHTEEELAELEEIFSYFEELKQKYGMRSLNMREAAQEVLDGKI